MANNIAVSVTADIADLQAKRAILSAELKTAQKDLRDFAAAAKDSGTGVTPAMLAAADAVAKTQAQIRLVDKEMRTFTGGTHENSAALGLNRNQMIIAQSAVMRFTDSIIAGQSPIRAFALEAHKLGEVMSFGEGGMAGSLAKLAPLINPVTIGIAAITVVAAGAAIATSQYQGEQEKLTATTLGLGAASGLTVEQLDKAGAVAATWSGQSVRSSTESAAAFAAAGVQSVQSIAVLSASVQTYAELTGQKAADAQKTLATAMQDPVKGAADLNQQLGILDSTQLAQIRSLTEAGDKEQAVAIITQALQDRMRDANAAGVGLNGTFGDMKAHLSDLWTWFGKVGDALENFGQREAAWAHGMSGAEYQKYEGILASGQHQVQQRAQWNQDSAAAMPLLNNTPEGKDIIARQQLTSSLGALQKALEADTHLHGANSEAAQRDAQAITEYKRAIDTYIPSAEKAHRIAELDAQISEAKRKHDKDQVESLTKQKELLNLSGQVMSPSEASQRASDAADRSGASTGAGSKGPSVVSQWEQQLHQQEIASGEFFKDQTASELAFWQSKLALTKAGSKDWLDVQSKIYDAEKTLARSDYQDHLATLNEQLEADRDNWAKEQADWNEKLSYIQGKFGEESSEYKNAYREMERAQHQHDDEMLRETVKSVREQIEARKKELDSQQKGRESTAQGAESVVRSDAGSSLSPAAEGNAAVRIAQINHQLNDQKIADLESFHAFETQMLDKAISDAQAKYGDDAARYKDLTEAKKTADQDYANSKAEIEAQSQARSIQDILAVRQAYAQSISGTVSATTSGLLGMAARTQTAAGAMRAIYSSVFNTIEQRLASFVTNWIVQNLLMTAAQRAQLAAQTAAHVGGEVAKTAATTAGETARVAATAAGATTSAAITSTHNLKEITSHAATAAAAAYHAMAGIPVVGPVLGAIAAATTFAAVEGFGVLASFDKGTNVLPNDMVAQIHAGERIVPAADNAQLIAAVNRGTSPAAAGDVHAHYSPTIYGGGGKGLGDLLRDGHSDMVSWVRQARRDGVI